MTTIFIFIIWIFIASVNCQGPPNNMLVGLYFQYFVNHHGTVDSGSCCDDKQASPSSCPKDECDIYFTMCGTRLAPSNSRRCDLIADSPTAIMFDDDEFLLGDHSPMGNRNKKTSPTLLVFKVPYFPEPIRFDLGVYEYDENLINKTLSTVEFIANWTIQTTGVQPLYTGLDAFIERNLTNNYADLDVSYTVQCSKRYYGPTCSVYCRPTYQYNCLDDGSRNCTEGWTGSLCNQMVDHCIQHNCINGGSCVNFLTGYNCSCPTSFAGQFCQNLKALSSANASTSTLPQNPTSFILNQLQLNNTTQSPMAGNGSKKISANKKSDRFADVAPIVGGAVGAVFLGLSSLIAGLWYTKRKIRRGKESESNKVSPEPSLSGDNGKAYERLTNMPPLATRLNALQF